MRGKCCLDDNNNDICDKDETEPTTTVPTTTTTTSTTTIQQTTTIVTTTIIAVCNANGDCGTSTEVNICYEGDIYRVTRIPMCKNPGTAESYCYIKQVGPSVQGQLVGKIEDCEFGCDPDTNPVSCRNEE